MDHGTTSIRTRVRDGVGRARRWWLLTGSRMRIAAATTVGFLVFLEVLYALGVIGYGDGSAISRMASGMTAGSFSLITIVLTINQLILSQELGTAGQVEGRLKGMISFRERVESTTGAAAAPARPSDLITILARSAADTASELSGSVEDGTDDRLRREIQAYATGVEDDVSDLLEDVSSEQATFDTLVSTFDYDDQWHIHSGRQLRNGSGDRLSAESRARLDDLLETLKLFDVARSHFETVYLRRELAALSRVILLAGMPAVAAALLVNLVYGRAELGLPPTLLPPVMSGLTAVVFAPVAILASYLLRAATVGYNNATVGPMVFEERDEFGSIGESGGDD